MLVLLKKMLSESTDLKLNHVISRGILKLNEDQIQTASFVFWLCYMAEKDLNDILKESWLISKEKSCPNPEVEKGVWKLLNSKISGDRELNIDNLDYFSDKIKIHRVLIGDNERTKIYWKLNDIRNALSHNKLDQLDYLGQSLYLRETKEKILYDYFYALSVDNLGHSKIWNELSEEDKLTISQYLK